MFKDRIDAGLRLSDKLQQFKNQNTVIVAIPRGGLPIGSIIAKALNAPLEVALTKKIGHPYQPEYAIGAVSLEDVVLTNPHGIAQSYIDEATVGIRKKLKERYHQYYEHRSPQKLKDKTVIIVDDGIATGNTLMATVQLIHKQMPARIVVAVPVAPESAIRKLEDMSEIDKVVCLEIPYNFQAVGQFYEAFDQVSDKEAIRLLEESNLPRKTPR
jgi:predicted phosphoribosyltransferase